MHLSLTEKTLGLLGFIPGVSTLSGAAGIMLYRGRLAQRKERMQRGELRIGPLGGRRLTRICERRIARAEWRLMWASAVQLVPLFNVFAAIYALVELGNISRFRGVRDSVTKGDAFRYLCQKYAVRAFSGTGAGDQNLLLESILLELHETELQNLNMQLQLRAGVELLFPVQRTVRRDAAATAAGLIDRMQPKELRETDTDRVMRRAFQGALDAQLQAIDRSAARLMQPPPQDKTVDERLEWLEERRLKLEHLLDNVVPTLQQAIGDTQSAAIERLERAREALSVAAAQELELRAAA